MLGKLDYKKQQRAYLTLYLPFKARLNEVTVADDYKKKMILPKTKLLIKTVSQTLKNNIASYCLYTSPKDGKQDEELEKIRIAIKDPDFLVVKDVDGIDKDYYETEKTDYHTNIDTSIINGIETKLSNYIGTKNKEEGTCVTSKDVVLSIDSISFSIFNDKIDDYTKTGIFKVRIKLQFKKDFTIASKAQAVRDVYHVFSRNVKEKKPKDEINFGFKYEVLTKLLSKSTIIFVDKKTYNIEVKEEDWLFNYNESDRRCYTFSFITHDENIEDFINEKNTNERTVKDALYHLSRLHENGFIRTYNRQNKIYDFYQDDTSAIWGVSRVGLGAICIQKNRAEFYRNIDVLNNDFSEIYEFSLHQKFLNYLISNIELNMKKRFFKVNDQLIRKEGLAEYRSIFCPSLISEFETQEIYELIINKLEIAKLFDDAEKNIKKLEAISDKRKNTALLFISLGLVGVLFPAALLSFFNSGLDFNNTLFSFFNIEKIGFRVGIYVAVFLLGSAASYLYYRLTGKIKEK